MHDLENSTVVIETPEFDASNVRYELKPRRTKRQRSKKSFRLDFPSTFIVERRDEID